MSSSAVSTDPAAKKFSHFFTQEWTLTIPSQPSLRIIRGTPAHLEAWLPILTGPANNEFQDNHAKVWDEAAIEEKKQMIRHQYAEANIKFDNLHVLIEFNNQIVGYGDIHPLKDLKEDRASIGIVVDKSMQRQGIGKLTVSALVQVCFEYGIQPVLGTMKRNLPMRALMASLGVPEVESITELPGRGILAEIDFEFERETWKRADIKVEFQDTAGE